MDLSLLNLIKCHKGFTGICSFIIHVIIQQIVLGYFDLYFLLFKAIQSNMKRAQKIVNNLIM